MPRSSTLVCAVAVVLAALAASCARSEDAETPVATPSVTLSRGDAAIGTPLEMNYRFVVGANAPPADDDYWVFVHFLDVDGELMWTDDHPPMVPTRQWKPGQTIAYPRTIFVPKFPYVGETRIEVGLFSPKTGNRIPMTGETTGQRAYQVGKFNLRSQTDNLFVVFKDGWHETEIADENAGIEWQWSRKDATLAFRNPRRDVLFYFQCDQPVAALGEPQRVELRIGGNVIDSFALAAGQKELRKIDISAAQFGDGETVEIAVSVDKTFVPAAITQLHNPDGRELGLRVFRAYVQPR